MSQAGLGNLNEPELLANPEHSYPAFGKGHNQLRSSFAGLGTGALVRLLVEVEATDVGDIFQFGAFERW